MDKFTEIKENLSVMDAVQLLSERLSFDLWDCFPESEQLNITKEAEQHLTRFVETVLTDHLKKTAPNTLNE